MDIPCSPDTDPKSFADVSAMLETVGASAYTGAAQLIQDRVSSISMIDTVSDCSQDYLTAAASILATESRQASWVNSAVRGQNPWSTAFEVRQRIDLRSESH